MVELELLLRNSKNEVRKSEAQEYKDKESLVEMKEYGGLVEREVHEVGDALVTTAEYLTNQDSMIRDTQLEKEVEIQKGMTL